MPYQRKPFTFDRVSRIFFSIILAAAIIYALLLIKNALLPFLIAWLFAYLLNPAVGFFQTKLRIKNRIAAIIATIITAIIIISGITWELIPSISEEIERMRFLIADYQSKRGSLPLIPDEWSEFFKHKINLDYLLSALTKEDIKQLVQEVAPRLWTFLSNSLNLLISILASVIVLLYTVFILKDFDVISKGFISLFPEQYRDIVSGIMDDISDSMNRYFRGQALVATCVGILYCIGFKIIGLPLAILLGIFTGILNLVPYLQIVGLIPTAFLSLLKAAETGQSFWVVFGLALLVLGVTQMIQDSIIVPKIMGKVTGLNPAIILLSLSIWGSLLGMIGLIIALPATTLCLSYYKRYILHENSKKNSDPYQSDIREDTVSDKNDTSDEQKK